MVKGILSKTTFGTLHFRFKVHMLTQRLIRDQNITFRKYFLGAKLKIYVVNFIFIWICTLISSKVMELQEITRQTE